MRGGEPFQEILRPFTFAISFTGAARSGWPAEWMPASRESAISYVLPQHSTARPSAIFLVFKGDQGAGTLRLTPSSDPNHQVAGGVLSCRISVGNFSPW